MKLLGHTSTCTHKFNMKETVVPLLICLFGIFLSVGDCNLNAPSNVGREFVFAFAENYLPNADPSLIITNMSPLDHVVVTVEIKSPVRGLLQTVTLQGLQSSELVSLPKEIVPAFPELKMVAVIVIADDDVAVFAVNDAYDRSMDGFTVLPVRALGTEYYVSTYTPSLRSQIVLVVTEPDTRIQIDLVNTILYKDREVKGGNTILIDTERAYEALLLNGRTDLTGTRILSNKPLAVLTGNKCAVIPTGVVSCDHLVEMLSPFNQWGTKFVVMPFLGRATSSLYRVIAGRDGTQVNVGSTVINLQQKEFQDFEINPGQVRFIQSSRPVQVVQFIKGSSEANILADPAMTIVPPMEQSVNSVKLATYNITKDLKMMQNYVNIYASCSDMYYSNLTVDDGMIPNIPPARILRADRSDYCAVGLPLNHGIHSIDTGPFGKGFVAIAYGLAPGHSYAWPAGLTTRSITCQYMRPDEGSLREYDCSKEIVTVDIPCNNTSGPAERECLNMDCISIDKVIYICAGVAVLAILIEKFFTRFVIPKTKNTKQEAFGQIGKKSLLPENTRVPEDSAHLAADVPEIAIVPEDSAPSAAEASRRLAVPSSPVRQGRRNSRQERADRMRHHSRSPSPAPLAYDNY